MNYVPNQNGKAIKERLAGFNSDVVKATLRHLKISPHSSVTLPHTTESIKNGCLG